MTNYIQSNQCVTLPDAVAYTAREADSGKMLLIPTQTAPMTITLPTAKAGLCYRFQAVATLGNDVTIQPADGALVTGVCFNFTPGNAAATAIGAIEKDDDADIAFTALARTGDYVDINCDGTTWFINGQSRAVGFA